MCDTDDKKPESGDTWICDVCEMWIEVMGSPEARPEGPLPHFVCHGQPMACRKIGESS